MHASYAAVRTCVGIDSLSQAKQKKGRVPIPCNNPDCNVGGLWYPEFANGSGRRGGSKARRSPKESGVRRKRRERNVGVSYQGIGKERMGAETIGMTVGDDRSGKGCGNRRNDGWRGKRIGKGRKMGKGNRKNRDRIRQTRENEKARVDLIKM